MSVGQGYSQSQTKVNQTRLELISLVLEFLVLHK